MGHSSFSKIRSTLLVLGVLLTQSSVVLAQEVVLINTDIDYQENILILDADDSGGDIKLQFGATLNKYLQWNNTNSYFAFSDDVSLEGNELLNFRIENLVVAPTCDASWIGRMYHNTTDSNSYICDGSSWEQIDSAGAASTSLAAVQSRRNVDFTLTAASTWYDIPLMLTDVETDTTNLQHNDTNTDNIDIKADGLYRITYQINASDATTTHQLESRVRYNDTTVLGGSLLVNRNYSDEYSPSTASFLAELNSGDHITLQALRTTANTVIGETSLNIVKLDGIKGDQGNTGAPGASYSPVVAQYYDNTGGLDVNGASSVALPWDSETREDTGYTHDTVTNNSRVYLDDAGWYAVSYNVSTESQTTNRKNIRCRVRLNGITFVFPSDSYSYSRNTTDEWASNVASLLIQTTSANEYYEVMCKGEGSDVGTAVANTVIGQSWTLVEQK